jgi:hypothetical protein
MLQRLKLKIVLISETIRQRYEINYRKKFIGGGVNNNPVSVFTKLYTILKRARAALSRRLSVLLMLAFPALCANSQFIANGSNKLECLSLTSI